ncbi:hypothetical protein [uncultured Paludibaculum sp.]|uniref:hypothetical protein n=1 Tax=uncultured Paludibaculum sp. TaxID=1765020 RepID=UPI002AAB20DA|nr:hypothetical protein [uncultured Paludibaculum sp.]
MTPDGGLIAATGDNRITVLAGTALEPIHRLNDCYEDARFTSNRLLWTCIRLRSTTVVLEAWDTSTWQRIAATEVRDPYGDSAFQLLPHPSRDSIVAWCAAGQDGQCLFWGSLADGAIVVDRFPALDDAAWPSFHPSGLDFLVVSGGELHRYQFPKGPMTGRMQWPPEDEDDQMGELVYYVRSESALLVSNNGRLLLVDLATMRIRDEIAIAGHEPRPIAELYMSLSGRFEMASDVSFVLPLSHDVFLSVHREVPSEPDEGRDHLLMWQIPELTWT